MTHRPSISYRRPRIERLEQRFLLTGLTWNLLTDINSQSNPEGPWSYNGGAGNGSITAVPQLMPLMTSNWQGIGVDAWTLNGRADAVPGFGVATTDHGGSLGHLQGDLIGHSPVIIRWTSPVTGTIAVAGSAFHPRTIGRTSTVILRENGESSSASELHVLGVLTDATPRNNPLNFRYEVDAVAGQAIDIMIGTGQVEFFGFTSLTVSAAVRGDFNGDSITDGADFLTWQRNFGKTGAEVLEGDGTGSDLTGKPDGIVDRWDLEYWKTHFGSAITVAPPQPAPVYHPAAIVVQTTGVTLPDGSMLDTSGSQTQGLQEAFNASAAEGWDVFVLPGTYTLIAHLDIEELQLRTFRFEDVTLNFSADVTDFGVRFDSTMLTNVYWKGGAINATNALDGLLFQPRTPHPLDGLKLGTIGVVDSAFHFNVPVNARTYKVTMNSQQATINDAVFYFGNVTPSQIRYVGGGFSPHNIFEDARVDDPIPFDLFGTAGRVTVIPVATEAGTPATVYLPDGSRLNVSRTQTAGLQEALDYAAAHDLDFLVFGRGIRNVAPFTNFGLYNMVEPLRVGDLANRTYRIYCVTWGNPEAGDLLSLGDMSNSTFEITGQLVGPAAGNVVVIRPDGAGLQGSSIRVQAVVGNNIPSHTAVRIDPRLASIRNSQFIFHEVNMGYYGIKVTNPLASTEFSGNLVRTLHTHAAAHIGVQMGEFEVNADRIYGNVIVVRTSTDGTPGEAAVQVWGRFNTVDLFAYNTGPGLHFGAKFEPGSNNNRLTYGDIQASIPIADYGSNNNASPRSDVASSDVASMSVEEAATSTGSSAMISVADFDIPTSSDRVVGGRLARLQRKNVCAIDRALCGLYSGLGAEFYASEIGAVAGGNPLRDWEKTIHTS